MRLPAPPAPVLPAAPPAGAQALPRPHRRHRTGAAVLAALLVSVLLWLPAAPAAAQPVVMTAGEHVGFTRVVLQSSRGFDWSLSEHPEGALLQILERPLRVDTERVFARIPRTRLRDLRRDGTDMVLVLDCPCPIRVNQERPGLVILDISTPPEGQASPRLPPPPPHNLPQPQSSARRAGASLAAELGALTTGATADATLAWPGVTQGGPALDPAGNPVGDPVGALATHLSVALSQGLATLAADGTTARALLAPAEALDIPGLPANLSLRAADSPGRTGDEATQRPSHCPDSTILEPFTHAADADFLTGLGDINQRLFGEFDQPDAETHAALVLHYLAWGFGAEARLLLDNAGSTVAGRDLLLGIADLIEDRHSNARQRLSGLIDCADPLPALAAVAGASDEHVIAQADRIGAGIQQLPGGLRMAIGPAAIERLAGVGASDAARIALEALRRNAPGVPADLHRLEAVVERSRGDSDRAAAHLDRQGAPDLDALGLRLEIALERGESLPETLLQDAAILATVARGSVSGQRLTELLIRTHAAEGRISTALDLLDRLVGWLEPTPTARQEVEGLRRLVWAQAQSLPDPDFLELALARFDWLDPAFDPDLRTGLANRFRQLGLEGAASRLGDAAPPSPTDRSARPVASEGDRNVDAQAQARIRPGPVEIAAGARRPDGTDSPGASETAIQRGLQQDGADTAVARPVPAAQLGTGIGGPEIRIPLLPATMRTEPGEGTGPSDSDRNASDIARGSAAASGTDPRGAGSPSTAGLNASGTGSNPGRAIETPSAPVVPPSAPAGFSDPVAQDPVVELPGPDDPMRRGVSALEESQRLRAFLIERGLALR